MAKNINRRREIRATGSSAASTLSPEKLGRTAKIYLRVLKPRETVLLTLIGLCTAVVAGDGSPPLGRFLLAAFTIILGSGGTNGLTNYLDRHVDARMQRTRHRVLPSRLIDPPEKALVWAASLVAVALGLALYLHPYAFIAGSVGVAAGLTARKTWATHFLGSFSSCGPVLVGWFVINPEINGTVVFLALVIVLWLPIHVWNLMISSEGDYLRAGVNIFPLNHGMVLTGRISVVLSVLLYAASLSLYVAGGFGWIYFVAANVGGILMVRATVQMLRTQDKAAAFQTFRISAYPFLGLTFLSLCADVWLRMLL
jgi:protoheme IX farnesyltransferase